MASWPASWVGLDRPGLWPRAVPPTHWAWWCALIECCAEMAAWAGTAGGWSASRSCCAGSATLARRRARPEEHFPRSELTRFPASRSAGVHPGGTSAHQAQPARGARLAFRGSRLLITALAGPLPSGFSWLFIPELFLQLAQLLLDAAGIVRAEPPHQLGEGSGALQLLVVLGVIQHLPVQRPQR